MSQKQTILFVNRYGKLFRVKCPFRVKRVNSLTNYKGLKTVSAIIVRNGKEVLFEVDNELKSHTLFEF